MMDEMEPVSDISKFAFYVVEKSVEDVEAFFRGKFLDFKINSHENEYTYDTTYSILRGDDAKIRENFCYAMEMPYVKHPTFLNFYGAWGDSRIARINSNPKFTLIESPGFSFFPFEDVKLAGFLQTPVYGFSSAIRWDYSMLASHLMDPKLPDEPFKEHYFMYRQPNIDLHDVRSINVCAENSKTGSQLKYTITQTGKPTSFEDVEALKNHKIKARFNRAILLSYLEQLGIDPIALIRDRDLSDAVLFVSSDDGEPVDDYVEDLEKYRSTVINVDGYNIVG